MDTFELVDYIDDFLDVKSFKDASYNGMQIEGNSETNIIVTAATASLDAIDAAISLNADTLLVHHGLFWKGQDPRIIGSFKERIEYLIKNNINLLAYHLPLDANLEVGNNQYLLNLLNCEHINYIEEGNPQSIAMQGVLDEPLTVADIANTLASNLDTVVDVLGPNDINTEIKRIAVCSGSGSFVLDDNKDPFFDALITGDVNEQTYHMANETGVSVFCIGHHASEQDGIRLLGANVASVFNIQHKHLKFAYEKNTIRFTS